MIIHNWLRDAEQKLKARNIESARLDTELLLSSILGVSRAKLLSMLERMLTDQEVSTLKDLLEKRMDHIPVAYLIKVKEFYRLEFEVNEHVLIPRPETETIVEWVVKNAPQHSTVLDIGTGSGAIACAIKFARSDLAIHASDISAAALQVAEKNARKHKLDITFHESDLFDQIDLKPQIITANLPYVPSTNDLNEEATHEPELALLSDNNGLDHYSRLFKQLEDRGRTAEVIIEANGDQLEQIKHNYRNKWKMKIISDYVAVLKLVA